MNFSAALAVRDSAERDRLIAAEIAAYDWLDVAASHMEHGGWPEQATALVLKIEADASFVRVKLAIEIVELCPQGCNAYPRRFSETSIVPLRIDRNTGDFEIVSPSTEPAEHD